MQTCESFLSWSGPDVMPFMSRHPLQPKASCAEPHSHHHAQLDQMDDLANQGKSLVATYNTRKKAVS